MHVLCLTGLRGVYHCSLKWAFTIPSGIEDPSSHVPDFQETIVSSKGYTISKKCVCFSWIIWRKLLSMIQTTQLPLPKARKVIPKIVARWNRSKGRIDEMTRSLYSMNFIFTKGSAKQVLVMREFKKMAINVGFILKHCFPIEAPPHGSGYSMIQRQSHRSEFTMKDVLYQPASSYKLMNPIRGVIPVSPT